MLAIAWRKKDLSSKIHFCSAHCAWFDDICNAALQVWE